MRNMSVSKTIVQVQARIKTQTRRLGWWDIKTDQPRVKRGDLLALVDKAMGLRRGQKPNRLAVVEVLSVRREHLDEITQADVDAEGFAGTSVHGFVEFFCDEMMCSPGDVVTVIEWRYLSDDELAEREAAKPKKKRRKGSARLPPRRRDVADAIAAEIEAQDARHDEAAERAARAHLGAAEQVFLPGVEADVVESGSCFTPQYLLDVAEIIMGGIDIDPFWHPQCLVRPRVQSYTKEQDGMRHDWPGRLWFQPDYGEMEPPVRKLAYQLASETTTKMCGLVKLDTSTAWWRELMAQCSAVCLLDHRVRHLGGYAKGKGADFCSAFVVARVPLAVCRRAYSGGWWFDPNSEERR